MIDHTFGGPWTEEKLTRLRKYVEAYTVIFTRNPSARYFRRVYVVENERASDRIGHLREVPAAVRFLSCEPLIGPLESLKLEGIDWVIVGGESGPGARPMRKRWVDSI